MTKKGENEALESTQLVFLLAIAGRIDAQSRVLAKKLDETPHIYYSYALVDALSSSYSMFKYFFDAFISSNNPDAMHHFMLTPEAIAIITAETFFLVTFSVLATHFQKEEKGSHKKDIAEAWPFFRDFLKALKNAYKGWRSAIVAVGLLGGLEVRYLIFPVGLALGLFATGNRMWLRDMGNERKRLAEANKKLLGEIRRMPFLTKAKLEEQLAKIIPQSDEKRYGAFFAKGLGGFIDALYLYVGVLGLAPLSHTLLAFLAVLCVFYTIGCIISRIYEEYIAQIALEATQTRCVLELSANALASTGIQFIEANVAVNRGC